MNEIIFNFKHNEMMVYDERIVELKKLIFDYIKKHDFISVREFIQDQKEEYTFVIGDNSTDLLFDGKHLKNKNPIKSGKYEGEVKDFKCKENGRYTIVWSITSPEDYRGMIIEDHFHTYENDYSSSCRYEIQAIQARELMEFAEEALGKQTISRYDIDTMISQKFSLDITVFPINNFPSVYVKSRKRLFGSKHNGNIEEFLGLKNNVLKNKEKGE